MSCASVPGCEIPRELASLSCTDSSEGIVGGFPKLGVPFGGSL